MAEAVRPHGAGNEIFGTERIGKLMLKFSIPSIVSMLVNSIYNLVDQIFIGWGVGYLGNAATSVAFPLSTATMALSVLVASGTAANISLNLGRGDQNKANRCFGNGFVMSVSIGIIACLIGQIFLEPLLRLFGATDTILPYAINYARFTLIGAPFVCVGMLMNDLVRADGSPRYAMLAMASGAITNIILDPVFIFVFHWGVQGAAIATVLGQMVTFIIGVCYFKRFKLIVYSKKNLRLQKDIVKMIVTIGFSSFVTQFIGVIVQAVINNAIKKYGALSIYGSDIPLTCFGIVMKVNQIFVSIIMGLTLSTQPIFGFNYGAGLYKRVKELVFRALIISVIVGAISVVVFQTFPQQIVNIFGQESELYNEFAVKCMRIVTMCLFTIALPFTSTMYYQSTGQPIKALILSLSRQIIFLMPLVLILPIFLGVEGVLYCFPISDVLAALVAAILLIIEIRTLNRKIAEQESVQ